MLVPTHVATSTTADSFPPEANHRYASPGGPSCGTCEHFSRGVCLRWQAPTGQTQVCDQYQALRAQQLATRPSRYTDQAALSDAKSKITAK